MFASNFTDPTYGYRKYLDLDCFLRNFIIGEFCGNTDLFWSVYMYKDSEYGKLYTGPTWDNDLSFENDYRTYPINNLNDYIYATKGSHAGWRVKDMVSQIVKNDPEAKKRLIELWEAALNEGGLSDLNSYLEDTRQLLLESQDLNFKRWKILNSYVHMNFQALGSYEAEVNFVKNYITARLAKFDQIVRQ